MNGENFLEVTILGGVLAVCLFLTVRFLRRIFGSASSKGCCGCPASDACDLAEKGKSAD